MCEVGFLFYFLACVHVQITPVHAHVPVTKRDFGVWNLCFASVARHFFQRRIGRLDLLLLSAEVGDQLQQRIGFVLETVIFLSWSFRHMDHAEYCHVTEIFDVVSCFRAPR